MAADFGKSLIARGDPDRIEEVIERTRLFHEIPREIFPTIMELRWFADGLFLISDEEPPRLYQAPLFRLDDLLVYVPGSPFPSIGTPP